MKGYIELLIKPGRRAVVDLGQISALFTSEGCDCIAVSSPDLPLTVLMNNGTEFETYGISVASIMVAMQTFGKIDGWLPLP